jgi:hypothetical protein
MSLERGGVTFVPERSQLLRRNAVTRYCVTFPRYFTSQCLDNSCVIRNVLIVTKGLNGRIRQTLVIDHSFDRLG